MPKTDKNDDRRSSAIGAPTTVSVQSVSYHPQDHIVAFAGTGHDPDDASPAPIVVYRVSFCALNTIPERKQSSHRVLLFM